jgi:hypothetical protein
MTEAVEAQDGGAQEWTWLVAGVGPAQVAARLANLTAVAALWPGAREVRRLPEGGVRARLGGLAGRALELTLSPDAAGYSMGRRRLFWQVGTPPRVWARGQVLLEVRAADPPAAGSCLRVTVRSEGPPSALGRLAAALRGDAHPQLEGFRQALGRWLGAHAVRPLEPEGGDGPGGRGGIASGDLGASAGTGFQGLPRQEPPS